MKDLLPPDGAPGGLTRQHRILLILLGLAMIGGRVWDMNHDRAAGPWMNVLVIVLGIVVLAAALLVGRNRPGH
ncbi:hypothetical protein UAJ10_23085 [Nitrospirillum sp. BR 11164]|uniref:hypothetical protein n=1 Tax=Nitrospirillum sp. BR 11164 TaxID=3104324 RepID=UPI002AFF7FB5|nr:hypothetical protein [Nitrospirillum sp. BR 11164]MEA1651884.1 hypothetical protein [Nitrospirillum sp. BR 11164]